MFPFNNHLIRRILNWKQGDEDDTWRNKATEMLIKKLKRPNPQEQYTTFQSVMSSKREDTPCITLNKSQDGRLQVSHRKMLPHVMYCRIFRWPDLQSQHELRSVPNCLYPYTRREHNKICVNPYHYIRVDHSIYPPVVTPRSTEFANASPSPQSPLSPGSTQQSSPISQYLTPVPQRIQTYQSPPHSQENPNDPFSYLRNHQAPQHNMNQNFYASQSPLTENNWYGGPHSNGNMGLPASPGVNNYYGQSSPPPYYSPQQTQELALMEAEDDPQVGREWCTITYAELNQKVGSVFHGRSPQIIVDGYTNPTVQGRRFSLGVLSNINRNSTIVTTRTAIGKGVCLENDDSRVYVTNLSDYGIFFHSKNCNVENQLNQHTVVKIEPQGRHKIFDLKVFKNLVHETLMGENRFDRLYSLIDHCTIKMSFVKGWGSIYQRQDVTSTPCWIEIHLSEPLDLHDQYLREAGRTSSQITSTS